jgi:carbon monoxide dehydrogenase subunit G
MEFDNSFEVPLPPAEAWPLLMDVRGIAPCMPGAELTDVVDDKTYKGKISVRLGPVALTFAGLVIFEEIDNVNHNARVKAQGTDAKGRGSAQALSTFRLEPAGQGSKVLVHTNLTLSGAVAQYGRGVGMIQATAAALMGQFANGLKAEIGRRGIAPAAAAPAAAVPSPGPAPTTTTASATTAPQAPPPQAVRQAAAPLPAAAKPISGFTLMWTVLWNAVRGIFGGTSK